MAQALVCTQCGHVGKTKGGIKGSSGVELVLWLFFVIPGLVYSIWRSSSRHRVCAQCGSKDLIPVDSPRGKKLMQENLSQEEIATVEASEKTRQEKERKTKVVLFIVVGVIALVLVYLISTV